MNYRLAVAVVSLVLMLSPHNMYAACPNVSQVGSGGCYGWHIYDVSECISTGGSVGTATLCDNTPGRSFDYSYPGGEKNATYQFTADSSTGTWNVSSRVDFNDPANSQWNFVWLQVSVTHNGNTTSTMYYNHNGTQGDPTCDMPNTNFSAQNGDTVTIYYAAQAVNSGVTIAVSDPYVTRTNC